MTGLWERKRWLVAVVGILSVLMTACGGSDDPEPGTTETEEASEPAGEETETPSAEATEASDGLEELIAAAQAEGSVTLFTATVGMGEAVTEAFEAEYGIEVEFLRASSSDLTVRLAEEFSSGTFTADVVSVTAANADWIEEAMAEGWLTPLDQADLPVLARGEFPESFILNESAGAVVQIRPWGIGYNTDLLSEDQYPTTWEDLLAPEFENNIILVDPLASDSYVDVWATVVENLGEDFAAQLMAQNPQVSTSGVTPSTETMASGEAAVVIPALITVHQLREAGAPVDFAVPSLTTGVETTVHLADTTKVAHPNAARLLANFLMERDSNIALAEVAEGVVSPWFAETNPDLFPSEYHSTQLTPANAEEKRQFVKDAFGF